MCLICMAMLNFNCIFLDSVGPQWDEEIRRFLYRIFGSYNIYSLYTCNKRCGLEQRNASMLLSEPRCYCDTLCDDFGDCCFDFDAL